MRFVTLATLLVLVGCGPHVAAPPGPPAAASTADEAPVPRTNGPCLAWTARDIPAGWTPSGSIVIAMKQGHPAQLTVRDGSKTIATETPVEERKIGEQIKSLTCRANAWLAVPAEAPSADRDVVFTLYRPSKNDEVADAAMLCKRPKEANDPSADEAQRAAIAAQVYIEQLTSVRYRSWFFQLDRALAAAESDASRVTIKQANGDKLVAMLGPGWKGGTCWFANVLAAARP